MFFASEQRTLSTVCFPTFERGKRQNEDSLLGDDVCRCPSRVNHESERRQFREWILSGKLKNRPLIVGHRLGEGDGDSVVTARQQRQQRMIQWRQKTKLTQIEHGHNYHILSTNVTTGSATEKTLKHSNSGTQTPLALSSACLVVRCFLRSPAGLADRKLSNGRPRALVRCIFRQSSRLIEISDRDNATFTWIGGHSVSRRADCSECVSNCVIHHRAKKKKVNRASSLVGREPSDARF